MNCGNTQSVMSMYMRSWQHYDYAIQFDQLKTEQIHAELFDWKRFWIAEVIYRMKWKFGIMSI